MGIREKIVELLKQRPFTAFRIILSNGHTHEIRQPELALVSPYYILVGVPERNLPSPAISDSVMVSMIHVAEVEPISKKSKPSK